jgi:DNA-binding beta-propeller fold protein YncE
MVILGSGSFTYEVSGENWGNLPQGAVYKEATAVDVDASDNVYVFNRGTHPIVVLNSSGEVLQTWGHGVFTNPHGVTVAPDGTVWCVDSGDHTVRQFTPDGKLLNTMGNPGVPASPMSGKPFSAPTHVGFDKRNGDFYVTDGYSNAHVHKYSQDGKHLFSWGASGTGEGQFNIVHYVGVDRDGWVYIADRENHRIQVFSPEGKFETQWVNLSRAACVYLDNKGEQIVYVGEYYGGIGSNSMGTDLGPRVTIFDTKGNVLAHLGEEAYGDEPGRFYSPHGIAVDSKGDIYVAEVSWTDYGSKMYPPKELRSMQKLVKKG